MAGASTTLRPRSTFPSRRPHTPPFLAQLKSQLLEAGNDDGPTDALFEQVAIDRTRLRAQVRGLLKRGDRVTLADVVAAHPLQHGLAELVGYFAVASEDCKAIIDEASPQLISWNDPAGRSRSASVPLVVFCR